MIYETDIIRELSKRIKKFFPTIKVENQDIKNTFKERPCFFVRSIQTVDTQTATNFELNSFSFEVVYFSEENNKGYLELLQVKRLLKAILNKPLKIVKTWKDSDNNTVVNTYFVEIESGNSNINADDYVLNYILEIKVEQGIDYADLGVDLDSENITDDELFNRETLEEIEADLTAEGQEINTFSE